LRQLVGDSALAATANANVVMFLVFAAVFGFGMAATVRSGRRSVQAISLPRAAPLAPRSACVSAFR